MEYHLLSRWIYCIYAPYQRYIYYGKPIGFPYGPDCDEFFAKYIHHLNKNLDLISSCIYLRKGENRINSLWPIPENPRVSGTSFPEDNFLSGTAQKILNINIGFRFFYKNLFFLELSPGYLRIQNHNHIPGRTKNLIPLRIQFDFLHI